MNNQIEAIASYGRGAGSSRVRLFDWIDFTGVNANESKYLDKSNNSVKALLSSPIPVISAEKKLRKLLRNETANNLIISRRASPFSNGDLESRLLRHSRRGIYDFDDSLYSIRRDGIQRLWSTSRTWERSVEAADFVIAGNEYLAEEAARFSKNIIIIPSCVNPEEYERKSNYSISKPRAVWIGSPSSESYLGIVDKALLHLHEKIGLRLTVISGGSASLGELDKMVDRVEWSPANYKKILAKADIGIMPLSDDEWTRGKCAYKLLQYGATGLPMVGSPVGANRNVLQTSQNLSPVGNEEWIEILEHFFAMDDASRLELGRKAFTTVQEKYSFQAWENTWLRTVGVGADKI